MDVLIRNQPVTLSTALGSPGGQATVFEIPNDPQHAAKIYRPEWLTAEQDAKNKYLMANPFLLSPGNHSMAHVRSQILDPTTGDPVGIVIDRALKAVDLSHIVTNSYVPFAFKLQIGLNVGRCLRDIHRAGHARGDISLCNDLVNRMGHTTTIDIDSLQINANGLSWRCGVGILDYQAPDKQGVALNDVDHTELDDRFAYGILLFQLLMDGIHPFDCRYSGAGRRPPLSDRIKMPGFFPYAPQPAVGVAPKVAAPKYSRIPQNIRDLFLRCFVDGHSVPYLRPRIEEWVDVLAYTCGRSTTSLSRTVWRNVLDPSQPVSKFTPNFTAWHVALPSRQQVLAVSGAIVATGIVAALMTVTPALPTSPPASLQANVQTNVPLPTIPSQNVAPQRSPTIATIPQVKEETRPTPRSNPLPILPPPSGDNATAVDHEYPISELTKRVGSTPGLWEAIRNGKAIKWENN